MSQEATLSKQSAGSACMASSPATALALSIAVLGWLTPLSSASAESASPDAGRPQVSRQSPQERFNDLMRPRSTLALILSKPPIRRPPIPRPVPLQPLPLRQGFYARVDRGCATHGKLAQYASLLTVQPNGLNDSAHDRRFVALANAGPLWKVDLASTDLEQATGEERLEWDIRIIDQVRFRLNGYDRGTGWGGEYVFCGTSIP